MPLDKLLKCTVNEAGVARDPSAIGRCLKDGDCPELPMFKIVSFNLSLGDKKKNIFKRIRNQIITYSAKQIATTTLNHKVSQAHLLEPHPEQTFA